MDHTGELIQGVPWGQGGPCCPVCRCRRGAGLDNLIPFSDNTQKKTITMTQMTLDIKLKASVLKHSCVKDYTDCSWRTQTHDTHWSEIPVWDSQSMLCACTIILKPYTHTLTRLGSSQHLSRLAHDVLHTISNDCSWNWTHKQTLLLQH